MPLIGLSWSFVSVFWVWVFSDGVGRDVGTSSAGAVGVEGVWSCVGVGAGIAAVGVDAGAGAGAVVAGALCGVVAGVCAFCGGSVSVSGSSPSVAAFFGGGGGGAVFLSASISNGSLMLPSGSGESGDEALGPSAGGLALAFSLESCCNRLVVIALLSAVGVASNLFFAWMWLTTSKTPALSSSAMAMAALMRVGLILTFGVLDAFFGGAGDSVCVSSVMVTDPQNVRVRSF